MSLKDLEQRVHINHWDRERSLSSIHELIDLLCWRGVGVIPTINALAFLQQEDGTLVTPEKEGYRYWGSGKLTGPTKDGRPLIWKSIDPVTISQEKLEANKKMAQAFAKDAVLLAGKQTPLYKDKSGNIGVVRKQFDAEGLRYNERHIDIFFILLLAVDVYQQLCEKAGVATEKIDVNSLIGKRSEFGWQGLESEHIERYFRYYDFQHSFTKPPLSGVRSSSELKYYEERYTHTSVDDLRKKVDYILGEEYGKKSPETLASIYKKMFEKDNIVFYVAIKDSDGLYIPETGFGENEIPGFDTHLQRFEAPVPDSIKTMAEKHWEELLSQGTQYFKGHKKELKVLVKEAADSYLQEPYSIIPFAPLRKFVSGLENTLKTEFIMNADFFARVVHFLCLDGPVFSFEQRLRRMKNAITSRENFIERSVQSSVISHFIYQEVCKQYGIEFSLSVEDFIAKSFLKEIGFWKIEDSAEKLTKLSWEEIEQIKGETSPQEEKQIPEVSEVSRVVEAKSQVSPIVEPVIKKEKTTTAEPAAKVAAPVVELAKATEKATQAKIFTTQHVLKEKFAQTHDTAGYVVQSKFDEYRRWLSSHGLKDLCLCFFDLYMGRSFNPKPDSYVLPQNMEQYQKFYDLLKQVFYAESLADIKVAFEEMYSITEVFPNELAAHHVFDIKTNLIDPLIELEKLQDNPKKFVEKLHSYKTQFNRNPYLEKKLLLAIKNSVKKYWHDKEKSTPALVRSFFSKNHRQALKELG